MRLNERIPVRIALKEALSFCLCLSASLCLSLSLSLSLSVAGILREDVRNTHD